MSFEPYPAHAHDLMTSQVLEREQRWLKAVAKQEPATGKAPAKWPGGENAAHNGKWKVRTLESEPRSVVSPLKEVGPGTTRAFWGRRHVHYSGDSSEGNRFITGSEL